MSRTFTYRFEDGCEYNCESLNGDELAGYEDNHGKCTYNGWAEFMGIGQPSRLGVIGGVNTRGDGFKSGYHPGLNMHISGPDHYSKVLKDKGMHEVGTERQKDKKRMMKSAIDEGVIQDLKSMGAEIGDVATEELMRPVDIEKVQGMATEAST